MNGGDSGGSLAIEGIAMIIGKAEDVAEKAEKILKAIAPDAYCVAQEWDNRIDCLIELPNGEVIGKMILLDQTHERRIRDAGDRLQLRASGVNVRLINELRPPRRITKTSGGGGRPKQGDRYIVISEFETGVLTTWRAPFTGGTRKTLPQGLEFIIAHDPYPQSTGVAADVIDYISYEPLLVNADDVSASKYSGYYLVVSYVDLATHCARLELP